MNVNLEIITGEGLKEISDKERIGSGGFGIVYKAKWRAGSKGSD